MHVTVYKFDGIAVWGPDGHHADPSVQADGLRMVRGQDFGPMPAHRIASELTPEELETGRAWLASLGV